MVWQTAPDIDITTDKRVQATIYITMLLEYLKTVASSVRSLTVNDTEKSDVRDARVYTCNTFTKLHDRRIPNVGVRVGQL